MTREYLTPESVVLEVGCGTGSTAIAHAPYVQHINASDFSSKMICIAKEKAAVASVRNINFVCRSVQEEITAGTCYDAILALNVLHLLKDWQEIIVSMQRLLKPGGVFVTSTPCLLNAPAWLGWIAPLGSSLGLMPQLSFFNQIELQSAFTSAGFEVVHCWQADSKYGLFLVARKS
jgi:2-polyprenyl-3-methyl-5-hydroxy-6-metoxy-1,4-benzoquinol methylase